MPFFEFGITLYTALMSFRLSGQPHMFAKTKFVKYNDAEDSVFQLVISLKQRATLIWIMKALVQEAKRLAQLSREGRK